MDTHFFGKGDQVRRIGAAIRLHPLARFTPPPARELDVEMRIIFRRVCFANDDPAAL